jgi:hypothetical protein
MSYKDKASDLYKIFHRSSNRNLLYLQTRVASLERKQHEFDREDYRFRIKDWGTHFKSEDEALDNYSSPRREILKQLEDRLEVLEKLEGEVRNWERSVRQHASGSCTNMGHPKEAIHTTIKRKPVIRPGIPNGSPEDGEMAHQPHGDPELREATQPPEALIPPANEENMLHGDPAAGERARQPQEIPLPPSPADNVQAMEEDASHGNPEVGDVVRQPHKIPLPASPGDSLQNEDVSSQSNSRAPPIAVADFQPGEKGRDLAPASGEQTSIRIDPTSFDEVYTEIHGRIRSLEASRNYSPLGLPSLPQDLSWGPVSDRGSEVSSRVPNDFLLHRECICKQPSTHRFHQVLPGYFSDRQCESSFKVTEHHNPGNECICYRANREGTTNYHALFEAGLEQKKGSHIIQMFQQRLRILEDYYLELWTSHRASHKIPENLLPEKTQPSVAILLAAKSWEDFEVFGSAAKMWERRRSWGQLNAKHPWPFDMSDEWIGRMRERFNVARDMQIAIKEYREFFTLRKEQGL